MNNKNRERWKNRMTSWGWAGPSSAIAGVEIWTSSNEWSSKINWGKIGLKLAILSLGKTQNIMQC